MRRALPLALAMVLGGCNGLYAFNTAPAADFPSVCEDQVYADPAVKSLLARSAGSESFARQHIDELRYAKLDAAKRCEVQRGIVRPGGVERQRPVE